MKYILSILALIISINCFSQPPTAATVRFGSGGVPSNYLTTVLADGRIIVGNGSGFATAVLPSGDVSMTNAGAFTVTKINNVSLASLATGILKNTTGTGIPSIAVAGDFPTFNQNTTGSAATLTTSRSIYGNSFNGSADLTQVISATFGGTGNGFTAFAGPAASTKTFTLPNASAVILTDNAVVTGAQGGTGVSNSGKTVTLANNLITSGNFSLTLTQTGTTNVTLPTSGTLAILGANTFTGAQNFGGQTIENYLVKYNNQTGTTYTLNSTDNGKIVTISNVGSITVTVPAGLAVGFNCTIVQLGAGVITFSASGTTLRQRQSFFSTAGQYAVASLISTTSNTFILGGDLQ